MALNLANYEQKARDAVKTFWNTREQAKQRQAELGTQDQGERSGVTAGKNMDGFVELAVEIIRGNGLTDAEIMLKKSALHFLGISGRPSCGTSWWSATTV